MAEESSKVDPSLAGLSMDDIKPSIYEGGFKTWECSIDLASYLLSERLFQQTKGDLNVIEVMVPQAQTQCFKFI